MPGPAIRRVAALKPPGSLRAVTPTSDSRVAQVVRCQQRASASVTARPRLLLAHCDHPQRRSRACVRAALHMHSRARGGAQADPHLANSGFLPRGPSPAFVFARVCAATPLACLVVSDGSNAQRVPGHRNRDCFAPALLVFHCVRRSVRSAFAATRVPVSAGLRLAGSVGGGDDVDGVRAFRAFRPRPKAPTASGSQLRPDAPTAPAPAPGPWPHRRSP
jgi:hypothetical protein